MKHNCLDNLESFAQEVPDGDNDMYVMEGYVCSVCGEYPDEHEIKKHFKLKEAKEKLASLYDLVSECFPDTASAISMAEDTLVKEGK